MRKLLIAAASVVALGGAVAGLAFAQRDGGGEGGPGPAGGPGGGHGRIEMFFQADANHDGTVTRQEFDAGREQMFARLDANHDGELTRDEQRAGWAGHGGRRHHRGMAGRGLERADANHDGNVSRDEFLARPIAMFERLDANHDGVIEAGERPQRHERGGAGGDESHQRMRPDANGDHQLSRAEFQAMGASMFDRLDANHDGRVTRAEADAARPHRQAE